MLGEPLWQDVVQLRAYVPKMYLWTMVQQLVYYPSVVQS